MSRPNDTDTLPLPDSTPGADAAVHLHGLGFDLAGFSEQGPRSENQDAYALESFGAVGLLAVADGMGGERGGRLAANTALRALLEAGAIRSMDDARRAARAADRAVAAAAREEPAGRTGMGCALALLSLISTPADGPLWIGAHVGDVRILSRASDGTVRLETRDHTPAFARWEAGEIELDSVPEAEGANRLQRAVGRGGEADVIWLPARPGWTYTIISDGVTKAMRLDELGRAMAAPTAAAACDVIRRKVEERGPDDNFTAVVVRIVGAAGASAAAPSSSAATPSAAPYTVQPSRTAPVTSAPRSPGTVVIGLLALLALLASGVAFWMVRDTQTRGAQSADADRARVEQLRQQVDSLRARVAEIEEPFGPATAAPPPGGAAPPR
ncbi:MAG: protein phosphatase 2C domain-containing protein [Gemmatimonadetes bacterium]|nr:protein phosphatase 2C domain-containing protein [Gemmatimonadota bacterium]